LPASEEYPGSCPPPYFAARLRENLTIIWMKSARMRAGTIDFSGLRIILLFYKIKA